MARLRVCLWACPIGHLRPPRSSTAAWLRSAACLSRSRTCRRPWSPPATPSSSSCSRARRRGGTLCTTWAVLRRHFARSFAERYEVAVGAVESACGPWSAEADGPPSHPAAEGGGDSVQELRQLLASHPRLPLQLGSWVEENVPGGPLQSHVAYARLNRELRKQCSGPGLYAAMTRDPSSAQASGRQGSSRLPAWLLPLVSHEALGCLQSSFGQAGPA